METVTRRRQPHLSVSVSEPRLSPADPAGHHGLLDANVTEGGVRPAACAGQVDAAAGVAAPGAWVVLRKAIKPGLALLRMRLGLLGLKAQTLVLSLKVFNSGPKQAQVLTKHRSRCALVEQRLQLVEQRFKQHISLHLFGCGHGSKGGAA